MTDSVLNLVVSAHPTAVVFHQESIDIDFNIKKPLNQVLVRNLMNLHLFLNFFIRGLSTYTHNLYCAEFNGTNFILNLFSNFFVVLVNLSIFCKLNFFLLKNTFFSSKLF